MKTQHSLEISMADQCQSQHQSKSRCLRLAHRLFSRTDRGYTLIELLIALSVALIGLIGGLMLYRSAHRASNVVSTISEMQQSARKALTIMEQEIQEANLDSAWIHSGNQGITFYSARNSTEDGNPFVVSDDGSPEWQQYVVYFLYPYTQTLYRYWIKLDYSAAATEVLATNVSDAYFSLDDNLLEISLTVGGDLQSEGRSDLALSTISTKILLRN